MRVQDTKIESSANPAWMYLRFPSAWPAPSSTAPTAIRLASAAPSSTTSARSRPGFSRFACRSVDGASSRPYRGPHPAAEHHRQDIPADQRRRASSTHRGGGRAADDRGGQGYHQFRAGRGPSTRRRTIRCLGFHDIRLTATRPLTPGFPAGPGVVPSWSGPRRSRATRPARPAVRPGGLFRVAAASRATGGGPLVLDHPRCAEIPTHQESGRSPYATWTPYASRGWSRCGPTTSVRLVERSVNENSRSTSELEAQRNAR